MKNNIISKVGIRGGYNPAELQDINNLAVIYRGLNNRWIPTIDNYKGIAPQRNLTGYVLGTNAAIYSPQGGLRATVEEMAKLISIYIFFYYKEYFI